MRKNSISILFVSLLFTCVLIITLYNCDFITQKLYSMPISYTASELFANKSFRFGSPEKDRIRIAVASCGDHTIWEQTLVMIKSALMFSEQKLHFIVVVDKNRMAFAEKLLNWPKNFVDRMSFEILLAHFPNVSNPGYYKQVFKPCSSQRLFYPILFPDYDALIHIDSDVIFMSPAEQLWLYFNKMNSAQMLAIATDNVNPNTSWYKLRNTGPKRIPLPTEYGLNTGIILMNLTRMRKVDFFGAIQPIVKEYRGRLRYFDQDVINIYLYRYPDHYLCLSCRWNYLTDHCSAGQLCESADTNGVALLHGSRGTFMSGSSEPAFRAVYTVFRDYKPNSDLANNLLIPLNKNLKNTENTECRQLKHIFLKFVEKICFQNH